MRWWCPTVQWQYKRCKREQREWAWNLPTPCLLYKDVWDVVYSCLWMPWVYIYICVSLYVCVVWRYLCCLRMKGTQRKLIICWRSPCWHILIWASCINATSSGASIQLAGCVGYGQFSRLICSHMPQVGGATKDFSVLRSHLHLQHLKAPAYVTSPCMRAHVWIYRYIYICLSLRVCMPLHFMRLGK